MSSSCPDGVHSRLSAQIDYNEFRRFVVLLPSNQLSGGNIVSSWIDSADWMAGVEYRSPFSRQSRTSFLGSSSSTGGDARRNDGGPIILQRHRHRMLAWSFPQRGACMQSSLLVLRLHTFQAEHDAAAAAV